MLYDSWPLYAVLLNWCYWIGLHVNQYIALMLLKLIMYLEIKGSNSLKNMLRIEIHQSAKVWTTPMLQLIFKSDKVSHSFKTIAQVVPQFTSKIWQGS